MVIAQPRLVHHLREIVVSTLSFRLGKMRRGAIITLAMLCTTAPVAAAECDCNRKIGNCTANVSWIGTTDWIQFTSNTPQCSLISYQLGDDRGNTFTVIGGSDKDHFERLPGKARPFVRAYDCVICADRDESRTEDR